MLAFGVLIYRLAGRRRPGEFPIWIAQTVGIESLVGLSLAAGEVHIALSLALGKHFARSLLPLWIG